MNPPLNEDTLVQATSAGMHSNAGARKRVQTFNREYQL